MISIQSKTILVVEDEAALLRSLMFTLKRFHYSVKGFIDGNVMLNELLCLKPEEQGLLITEIQLPELTGFELIDKIRSCAIGIPVLAIISFKDHLVIDELEKRSVHDYLTKPFKMNDLIKMVDSFFSF